MIELSILLAAACGLTFSIVGCFITMIRPTASNAIAVTGWVCVTLWAIHACATQIPYFERNKHYELASDAYYKAFEQDPYHVLHRFDQTVQDQVYEMGDCSFREKLYAELRSKFSAHKATEIQHWYAYQGFIEVLDRFCVAERIRQQDIRRLLNSGYRQLLVKHLGTPSQHMYFEMSRFLK